MGISDTQYKNLMDAIRALEKNLQGVRDEVGEIDKQLAEDRHDIGDFKVELATMKAEIKQFRHEQGNIAEDIKDKVQDVVDPAIKQVDNLSNVIKKKKTLYIFKDSFKDWVQSKWMATAGRFGKEIKKELGR